MSVHSESTPENTSRMMYFIIILYLLKNSPNMTLWVSQSVSNGQSRLTMSVDSESTPEKTYRQSYENISSFHYPSNSIVHCAFKEKMKGRYKKGYLTVIL